MKTFDLIMFLALLSVLALLLLVVLACVWWRLRRRRKVTAGGTALLLPSANITMTLIPAQNNYTPLRLSVVDATDDEAEDNSTAVDNSSHVRNSSLNSSSGFQIPGYDLTKTGDGVQLVARQSTSPSQVLRLKPGSPSLGADKTTPFDLNEAMYMTQRQRKTSALASLAFALHYCPQSRQLEVILTRALHLPDYGNEQCVISLFLTTGSTVYHTQRLNGYNPEIGETFTFPIEKDEINTIGTLLKFNVWTVDGFSQKSAFGYVHVDVKSALAEQELIPHARMRRYALRWYQIKCTDQITDESIHGKLLLSLCYLPSAHRLGVILIKATNLSKEEGDKALLVETTLYHGEEQLRVKGFELKDTETNPIFNQEVTFDLTNKKGIPLNERIISIRINVLCKPARTKKYRLIGSLEVGLSDEISREGVEHWTEVLEKSRTSVARWHDLRL